MRRNRAVSALLILPTTLFVAFEANGQHLELDERSHLGAIDIESAQIRETGRAQVVQGESRAPLYFHKFAPPRPKWVHGRISDKEGLSETDRLKLKKAAEECDEITMKLRNGINKRVPEIDPETVDQYDACIYRQENRSSADLRLKEIMKTFLAVLVNAENGRIFCNGVFVSKNYILTARHCISADFEKQIRDKSIFALSGAEPSRPLFLSGVFEQDPEFEVRAWGKYDQQGDYVLVHVQTRRTGANVPILRDLSEETLRRLDEGPGVQSVVIPGFSALIAYRSSSTLSQDAENQRWDYQGWERYIRYDDTGGCVLHRRFLRVCVLHSCHTAGGISGSPILLKDIDPMDRSLRGLVLIGVHSGPLFKLDSDCSSEDVRADNELLHVAPNLGNLTRRTWILQVIENN